MDPCKVLLSRGVFQTLVDTQNKLQDLLFAQSISKLKQVTGGDMDIFFNLKRISVAHDNPGTKLTQLYKTEIF